MYIYIYICWCRGAREEGRERGEERGERGWRPCRHWVERHAASGVFNRSRRPSLAHARWPTRHHRRSAGGGKGKRGEERGERGRCITYILRIHMYIYIYVCIYVCIYIYLNTLKIHPQRRHLVGHGRPSTGKCYRARPRHAGRCYITYIQTYIQTHIHTTYVNTCIHTQIKNNHGGG